ncbi:MAG: leucyl/phenylalanyl-tRNA--protein transferase [Altibacter sp.]|uniref:leucyl/phenylalanyl-tRNA--protein transferase n=1 Tax=Altibacter sp. TaxID=2024823 RepID=UPI001DF7A976|nr:leucyl/phenylalanyl-tRNA--protein transferase [Altibacter sp.]MBZ0327583.1 leucyl/phenylalanyl-tRNA--protein transferase [Altibacter sp.]
MHFLTSELVFPSVTEASEEGLLAIGGDLSVERLLLAYRSGIFPWFDNESPILWWSPDPRMVLFPENLNVSKSLQKKISSHVFRVTFNTAFSEVIQECASVKRSGQSDTWITPKMVAAYVGLHQHGHAFSVEVWQDQKLVGGIYGVDLPERGIFCGESMFSHITDASKVGLYHLVAFLKSKEYQLIDCQVFTKHLASLGAEEIPRDTFLSYLKS